MRRRRNRFEVHAPPARPMSSALRISPSLFDAAEPPVDLGRFVTWFEAQDDCRERFRWVLRDSLDDLLDGQRTGRWCYQHLSKTEKTHLGTVIEINLTKEFEIPDGHDLDWQVAGEDLDCKVSRNVGGWEIPREMYRIDGDPDDRGDKSAMLIWLSDDDHRWAAGLVRITDDILRWRSTTGSDEPVRAYNRDFKRLIARDRLEDIFWLWGGEQTDLPPNLLLDMPENIRSRIFSHAGSGQARVDELFRLQQGRLIQRPVVLTVGQQDDAPKRARDARPTLRPEGILILGHLAPYPDIARRLGLPAPQKGEWLSVRVAEIDAPGTRPWFEYQGRYWTVATLDDPVAEAPVI